MLPLLRSRKPWHAALAALAMIAGFALIQWTPQEVVRASRPFVWGLASMLVVGAAVALEETAARWMPRWLLALGDASYSNYLLHTLVLAALGSIWVKVLGARRLNWSVATGCCVIMCAMVAQLVYRIVELPMTQTWKRRRV